MLYPGSDKETFNPQGNEKSKLSRLLSENEDIRGELAGFEVIATMKPRMKKTATEFNVPSTNN